VSTGEGAEPEEGGGMPDGLVFDEAFVRGAIFKEESARTRELLAQRRRAQLESDPAGLDPHSGSGSDPDLDVEADQPPDRGSRRGRAHRFVIPLLVLALMIAWGRLAISGGYPDEVASPAYTPSPSGTPANVCYAGEAGHGSISEPYADTPCAAWADGAAGIVLPPIAATRDFSSAQVSAALALSKQFAIDQAMLPDVLVKGAKPTAMLALMSSDTEYSDMISSQIAAPSHNVPTNYVVRFDPKSSALITTPKASGTVTYSQVQAGVLEVDVSVSVVYALKKPDGSAWTRTMAVVGDEFQCYDGPGPNPSPSGSLWPDIVGIDGYDGAQYEANAGFETPKYPPTLTPPIVTAATATPAAPASLSATVPALPGPISPPPLTPVQ
jgi:hypothetical protein